jgi:hypothetical protein
MKHADNQYSPTRRPTRLSLTALRNTHRFGFDVYEEDFFRDMKRRFLESPPPGRGPGEYDAWREKRGIQDNTEARIRYNIYLADGQCRMLIAGSEYELWQFRKMALESLFFDMP